MRALLASLLLTFPLAAADLIPKPRQITPSEGTLLVDVQTAVIAPAALADHAQVIALALQKTTGFLHRVRTPQQLGRIRLNRPIKLALENISDKPGFYRLEITPEGIVLTASNQTGLMHGAQTIANLLPVAKKPQQRALLSAQTIEDWPETARRIFHLDVGAHLFPTEDLKTLIDWLSFHKLNELHLQLNNNHGWRLESTRHPKLHEIGSIRSSTPPYGDRTGSDSTEYRGYYTAENIRDLLAHAKKRGLTVVPALSLTTEAAALIASYPELGKIPPKVSHTWKPREKIGVVDSPESLAFLDALFGEIASLFPATEIRIEGPVTSLHPKIKTLLKKHDRDLLLPADLATTDLSLYQRPADEELLASPAREARGGFNPVSSVFGLEPTSTGAQASLQTEFIHDFEKLQYAVFPRLAAFAEATWLAEDEKNYDSFRTRLKQFDARYRLAEIGAAVTYDSPVLKTLHNSIVTTNLESRKGNAPELIFDGDSKSFFWSAGGIEKGNHLTLEFPWPVTGEISVATGHNGSTEGLLEEGFLELSDDGNEWHRSEPFISGRAAATARQATRFVRLRATAAQKTPLVLQEVMLSEPLLAPLHEESRTIRLPVTKKEIILTFKADFRGQPTLRPQVQEARRFFFAQWLPLTEKIGVTHFPGTPRAFEIKAGEPGEMAPKQVWTWMTKRMVPWLQNYPLSSPLWFTSGFTALLLGDLPDVPDRSKYLGGGPQSAAFLTWIAEKHGPRALTTISQDCRRGQYRLTTWKTLTRKSLDELAREYQENGP